MTVDQNLSSRINLMRILLISGIVFVHVPHNAETSPFLGLYGFFDWLRVFLGDALFRIGVPCLSAISGYLLFRRGMSAFDYPATIRSKTKTVLLPFLLWNGALFAAVLLIQLFEVGVGYFPDLWNASPREILSHGTALEELPVNVPLYFLRDLFVCILLSPVLAFLMRRFALPTLVILLIVTAMPDLKIFIVQKKSILFSFSLGIALALHRVDVKALDPYALPIMLLTFAASAILATGLYFTGPEFTFWLNMSRNLARGLRRARLLGVFIDLDPQPAWSEACRDRQSQLLDILRPLSAAGHHVDGLEQGRAGFLSRFLHQRDALRLRHFGDQQCPDPQIPAGRLCRIDRKPQRQRQGKGRIRGQTGFHDRPTHIRNTLFATTEVNQ